MGWGNGLKEGQEKFTSKQDFLVNSFSFLQAQIENYFLFVCFSLYTLGNTLGVYAFQGM